MTDKQMTGWEYIRAWLDRYLELRDMADDALDHIIDHVEGVDHV